MKISASIELEIDDASSYVPVDGAIEEVIEERVQDALYDLDNVTKVTVRNVKVKR